MSKTQTDWMEKLVENYRVPVQKEKGKRILTNKQLEIIKKTNQ